MAQIKKWATTWQNQHFADAEADLSLSWAHMPFRLFCCEVAQIILKLKHLHLWFSLWTVWLKHTASDTFFTVSSHYLQELFTLDHSWIQHFLEALYVNSLLQKNHASHILFAQKLMNKVINSNMIIYEPPHDKTNKMTCAPSEDCALNG